MFSYFFGFSLKIEKKLFFITIQIMVVEKGDLLSEKIFQWNTVLFLHSSIIILFNFSTIPLF